MGTFAEELARIGETAAPKILNQPNRLEDRARVMNEARRRRGKPPVWTPETIRYADSLRRKNNDYTIAVPGVTDFIRVPGLESEQLRFQRWLRFKNSEPLLPEALRWAPKLINKIDDAQDLLFTGLVLLRPLLKFLPKLLLGPLGWLLVFNDVLNLGT